MRPMTNAELLDGGNLTKKQRLLAGARDLWNVWEIHCLVLLSLFLQVLLLLKAGMRRRSASSVLRTVLWLAYLSADSVAIFVLGHLAAHASGPRHQLMFFWAPFVLVHLGGQDTITAFSKQDNELWRRHLLSLVFHIAFAGYVVAKASWPDSRLRAAMVLMFLCGCFKYAERTYCLYCACPSILISGSVRSLSHTLRVLQRGPRNGMAEPRYHWTAGFYNWEKSRPSRDGAKSQMEETFDMMLNGRRSWQSIRGRGITGSDITSVDALHNTVPSILLADDDDLPGMLGDLLSNEGRHRAYEYVGVRLAHCYQRLYTKNPLREAFYIVATDLVHRLRFTHILIDDGDASPFRFLAETCLDTLFLLCSLFSYVSTPVALVLFMAAEKGDELHTSRADITVSYILLVGAIALDMSSATISILSNVSSISLRAGALLRCIQPAWSSKQWSEEIAQYSMIRRHATQDNAGIASSARQWIGKRLDRCSACHGGGGVGFFDLTYAPVTRGHTPILEFVLDQLLRFGTDRHWDIASSRGRRSLGRWMSSHPVPADSELYKTTDSRVDFPMSVLIWHIATDICYYYYDLGDSSPSSDDRLNKRKRMSRELSNYIMYLVFKCGVMLTSQSQFVHEQVHSEIRDVLAADHRRPHQQVNLGEKEAVMTLFKAIRKEAHQQDSENKTEMQKHEEESDDDENDKGLKITRESIYSPVLPRACEVAHELISINDENHRWELIASLWSEMLYYTAPRCGGAFHYKHLSTGGEFITHVLFLMYSLGPFLPSPAGA